MNRKLKTLVFTATLLFTVALSAQSREFKAGKSLDIQFSVLRELSLFYVDSIEVDKLVKTGINAMVESLDPYTVYIPEEEEESIELLTTGSYGGIGALIKKIDSGIEISEVYENSPASKAGLVAGDVILKIDTISTLGLSVEQCSSRMKGTPGSEVKFVIKRLKGGEIKDIKIVRERVHFPDVAYWGMVSDTVGYIRIVSFTLDGAKDVKNALLNLKKSGKMKRLVIDLRGNGGGLLDEAVNIVSLFVPSGTKVVSALGRQKQTDAIYYTKEEPVDTQLPLLVLVNSGSASSSEIVAGALQDLDRATIVGTKTYGKGLVQSIRDVGYNNKIKLTTAKYYTPSGRCVQAIDYNNRNEDGSVGNIPDSLIKAFKTTKGRVVYDGGGIAPDVKIEAETYSRPSLSLLFNDILKDYSILYFRDHPSIESPSKFKLTDEEFNKFVEYASGREFDHRTASEVDYDRLMATAKREGLINEMDKDLKLIESKIKLGKSGSIRKNADEIKSLLEEEIVSRYYFQRGRIESIIRKDKQLKEAIVADLIKF
ncbi:MAG: hypothetical protein ACD_77C00476G0013 [uncultured bacterium]|nr:MAG: hypothetical protein ACD_77C00476G0013 [uncultured bacterium]HBY01537.1 peptidase S41 [Rikenellaceae bacterium]